MFSSFLTLALGDVVRSWYSPRPPPLPPPLSPTILFQGKEFAVMRGSQYVVQGGSGSCPVPLFVSLSAIMCLCPQDNELDKHRTRSGQSGEQRKNFVLLGNKPALLGGPFYSIATVPTELHRLQIKLSQIDIFLISDFCWKRFKALRFLYLGFLTNQFQNSAFSVEQGICSEPVSEFCTFRRAGNLFWTSFRILNFP